MMDWIEVYDQYLEKQWTESNLTRRQDCFHCSELGYCHIKACLRRSGLILLPDANRMRRLRQGTIVHEDYQKAWAEMLGLQFISELNLDEYLPEGWSGTTDALYLDGDGDLADIKTVNPNAFRYSDKWPKVEHCLQLGSYWSAAEKAKGRTIKQANIIYVPLGDYTPPLVVPVDPTWKQAALIEMGLMDDEWIEYVATGQLPMPPQAVEGKKGWAQNWECSPAYCDYRSQGHCDGGPSKP